MRPFRVLGIQQVAIGGSGRERPRLERLIRELDLERHVTLLDPHKVQLGVNVFIQVSLERQVDRALESFENTVREFPQVMECYQIGRAHV